MSNLWGGRFGADPSAAMRRLSSSTHFDMRLLTQDRRVLNAHVSMLVAAKIMSQDHADAIRSALETLEFQIQGDEDVHSVIERVLHEHVPEAVGNSRAGLSRNDRVATAFRLWVIENSSRVKSQLLDLIEALKDRAKEHAQTIMPGYTHLQRAQVVTLGLHLSAHALALLRDCERIDAAVDRANEMPLGAGALAGSTLGLDRSIAQRELGFARIMPNTMDAVSSRDFALEALSALAILGVDISRLAEDVILWTTSEFGFAELDDSYATGSSLMPQKKNPDVAELARGKTGRLIGNLTALLTACKALPLTYNRDLQEDKEPVFDSVETLLLVLPALTGAISTMRFHADRMSEASSDSFLLATDLAEELVLKGVPFRDAHDQVGSSVVRALANAKPLETSHSSAASANARVGSSVKDSLEEISRKVAEHRMNAIV
ncbi:MAG: argininosuccinate lyase [Actinomycetota bacterium]